MASLDTRIRMLEKLASDLNEASDSLNETLVAVEERIRDTQIGLEVWLPDLVEKNETDDGDAKEPGHTVVTGCRIGWAKLGRGVWRLVYRSVFETWFYGECKSSEDSFDGVMPLVNAPRNVRLGALKLLPPLVHRLSEAALERLKEIEAAKKLLERSDETLREGPLDPAMLLIYGDGRGGDDEQS